jgi:hypothetical protein
LLRLWKISDPLTGKGFPQEVAPCAALDWTRLRQRASL